MRSLQHKHETLLYTPDPPAPPEDVAPGGFTPRPARHCAGRGYAWGFIFGGNVISLGLGIFNVLAGHGLSPVLFINAFVAGMMFWAALAGAKGEEEG